MTSSNPLDWSLISGPLPDVLVALGVLAGGYLVLGPRTVLALGRVPVLLFASLLLTAGLVGVVDRVWQPFPDPLPDRVVDWLFVAVSAVVFTAANAHYQRWPGAVRSAGAAAVVLVACAVGVNVFYGQYPTVRMAVGMPLPHLLSLAEAVSEPSDTGRLAEVDIPGATSGFRVRSALVYVPPGYGRQPAPVVVLLAGQPGSPRDLFTGGRMAEVLDGLARRHGGRAPVVVVPDDLGAPMANPLCLDSRLGRAADYLTRDVPEWIRRHLTVDADPTRWAIGGYSHGGTCALQLAVGHPDVYPTFIDVSGQSEPTLGNRDKTVRVAFGGDVDAFRRVNPLDVLAHTRLPNVFGVLVAGLSDQRYLPQQLAVRAACESAGMTVAWVELPGGHTWAVWGPGLAIGLDRIASRLGLEQK